MVICLGKGVYSFVFLNDTGVTMSNLKVAVVMGSDSDWPVMQFAVE